MFERLFKFCNFRNRTELKRRIRLGDYAWYVETSRLDSITASRRARPVKRSSKEQYKVLIEKSCRYRMFNWFFFQEILNTPVLHQGSVKLINVEEKRVRRAGFGSVYGRGCLRRACDWIEYAADGRNIDATPICHTKYKLLRHNVLCSL